MVSHMALEFELLSSGYGRGNLRSRLIQVVRKHRHSRSLFGHLRPRSSEAWIIPQGLFIEDTLCKTTNERLYTRLHVFFLYFVDGSNDLGDIVTFSHVEQGFEKGSMDYSCVGECLDGRQLDLFREDLEFVSLTLLEKLGDIDGIHTAQNGRIYRY